MSDDRFKQARRSLIDRNKQRQQQQDRGGDNFDDDDFHEDEKTLMVNVDELQGSSAPSGPPRPSPPRPSPPRQSPHHQSPPPRGAGARGAGASRGGDFGRSDDFADAATQMVDLNELEGQQDPGSGQVDESTAPHREAYSPGHASPAQRPGNQHAGNQRSHAQQRSGGQQVFAPGGGSGGYEGKTDFINVSDFAQQNAEFTPDSSSAGYEGKTAFIHIDSLQGAQQQSPAGPPQQIQGNIANDQMLRQSYQFGPESVQQGEVTLIFAQNPLGRQVVLRQVWAGNPSQMPPDIRQRIAQLDALEHPRLVKLNGVVATQTGLWADLEKPQGYRLSAVLEQHGPQDKENVITWIKQVAEVLDELHNKELLYANLTPDAIWIQEDNSILLEPFDLLSFEKRGDLGSYGPQELKRPPSDRVLSPATDVFSLAAISAAAITGLPFHAEKLVNHEDQKLAKKLQAAMSPNPNERPQSASEFANQFTSGGFSLSGLSLDPAELDIKIVAAIAVLLLGGFAGYMYWNQQQAQAAAQEQARQAAMAQEQVPPAQAAPVQGQQVQGQQVQGQQVEGEQAQGEQAEGAAAGNSAAVAPPGAVEADPRINIVSSFQTNPPDAEAEAELSQEDALAEAEKLRAKAKEHIKQGDDLRSDHDKRTEYTAALEALTAAIRLSGDKPSEEDQKLLDELGGHKVVREYRKDLRERIESAIGNGAISDARRSYNRLHAIDPQAKAAGFFQANNSATVRTISTPSDDDQGNDD